MVANKSNKMTINQLFKSAFLLLASKFTQITIVFLIIVSLTASLIYPVYNIFYEFYLQAYSLLKLIYETTDLNKNILLIEQFSTTTVNFLTKEYGAIAYLIALITISSTIFSISLTYILGFKEKNTLRNIFLKSLKKIPMIYLSFIVWVILIIFSTFPLIIPGILIGFFLSFSHQEIIINNRSAISAFKRSIDLVGSNFKYLAKRYIVLTFFVTLVTSAVDLINTLLNLSAYWLINWSVYIVTSYLLHIFTQAYWVVLYKNISDNTADDIQVSKTWIYVFWSLGVCLFIYSVLF